MPASVIEAARYLRTTPWELLSRPDFDFWYGWVGAIIEARHEAEDNRNKGK